jgi:serine/threonine protein kinase
LERLRIVERSYDYFEHERCYYQAKEFMTGRDLHKGLYEPAVPLTEEQRRLIATVMMYGIRVIHEAGIVHTDLKPQQIYLEEDPSIELKYRVKIVDFDSCRIPGQSEPLQICTTPFYSSPEHLRGGMPDFSSDVFTCGLILGEVLAGAHPVRAETAAGYADDVLKGKIPTLKELHPSIPVPLSNLVARALNPDSSKRPSAKELHETLAAFRGKEAVPEPVKPTMERPGVGRVIFESPGLSYPVSVHKPMVVGRKDFRFYQGYQYLSSEQIRLGKDGKDWVVEAIDGVKNPTTVNGEVLGKGARRKLVNGDTLAVGEFRCAIRLFE